jgi:hypothetical protein
MHQHTQHIPSIHGIPVVQQPPYSPDMAPCDFWLFPKLKTVLNGKRFVDIDAIQKNATGTLHTIPKDSFSKNVSCSGRTAGSSVSAHKESILKIIKYFYLLAIKCNFHSPSLGIF